MRIATWNMAYCLHRKLHADAWCCFLNETGADIFFFQEGWPTESMVNQKGHLVWHEIGGRRNWGSGIYSEKYEIIEETIKTDFKGVFSIGNASINNEKLTLISLYGLMESSGPTKGYCIPNLHRMISDLTGLFLGKIDGKRKIIMAGDLNASTQIDEMTLNKSHKILFDRIEDFGLKDVYKLSGSRDFVQTLRHSKSQKPWQNDYFFISESLVKNYVRYEIRDNPEIRKYSDHNPIVLEMSF